MRSAALLPTGKTWSESKTALRNYEAGYRRVVRQRVARGEGTVAEINEMNRAFAEVEEAEAKKWRVR